MTSAQPTIFFNSCLRTPRLTIFLLFISISLIILSPHLRVFAQTAQLKINPNVTKQDPLAPPNANHDTNNNTNKQPLDRQAVAPAASTLVPAPNLLQQNLNHPAIPQRNNTHMPFQTQQLTLAAATKSYIQGDYQTAITQYLLLQNTGLNSASLHFNLGNAYFRLKQLARAIFHYKMALAGRPRDPDIRYNLQFSRSLVKDKLPSTKSWYLNLKAFSQNISLKESYLLFFIFSLMVFTLLMLNLRFSLPKAAIKIPLAALLLASLLLVYRQSTVEHFGVVLANQSKVYSGIGRDNVNLFTLNEGAEIQILNAATPGWTQIQLRDNSKGWIKAEEILFF